MTGVQGPQSFLIETLGCKANVADSHEIQAVLEQGGWQALKREHLATSDTTVQLCIVNSCTVTDEADQQSRRTAQQLAKQYPGAQVVVVGCGVEVQPESFRASTGVTTVVRREEQAQWLQRLAPASREFTGLLPKEASRTRAFLKVQEGCQAFCTYCVIPYARGIEKSMPLAQVVQTVQQWVTEQGVQEVVLTGTNLGDYGLVAHEKTKNRRLPLVDLVEAILGQTSLKRLRLSSLDPSEIQPSLIALMVAEPRLCAHWHIALQHPLSPILRLMKRRYRREEVEQCLSSLCALASTSCFRSRGGITIGMDVITGFPGETPELFEEAFECLQKWFWTRLHVFPYSERSGTPATRLPGKIPLQEQRERARRLRELSLDRLEAHYQSLASLADAEWDPVLLEHPDSKGGFSGLTANGIRIWIAPERAKGLKANTWIRWRPQGVLLQKPKQDATLLAEPLV